MVDSVEKVKNGYKINGSVTVFNLETSKDEGVSVGYYDIEYDEDNMTPEQAIKLSEYFFERVYRDVVSGKWFQRPPRMIVKSKGVRIN